VTVRGSADDGYDFTGPAVGGDRTDRHLGLVWGDVPGDGTLHMFRGAKLRLVDVPPGLITEAMLQGRHLVARIRLTGDPGQPGLRPAAALAPHLVRRADLSAGTAMCTTWCGGPPPGGMPGSSWMPLPAAYHARMRWT